MYQSMHGPCFASWVPFINPLTNAFREQTSQRVTAWCFRPSLPKVGGCKPQRKRIISAFGVV